MGKPEWENENHKTRLLTFASDGMEEIHSSKGTSGDRVHRVTDTRKADLGVPPDMGEDVGLAHFNESQLGVVAVGEIV